jgi:hypothetical protein
MKNTRHLFIGIAPAKVHSFLELRLALHGKLFVFLRKIKGNI